MSRPIDRNNTYIYDQIHTFTVSEAIRNRPGMYIGSVDVHGLHCLLDIVIDKALQTPGCNHIKVEVCKNGAVIVTNNGRGISNKRNKQTGRSVLETCLMAYQTTSRLGNGMACVNALSKSFEIITYGKNYTCQQVFALGKKVYELEAVGRNNVQGTIVRFCPDPILFTITKYDNKKLRHRLWEFACLNKQVCFELIDDQVRETLEKLFCKNGLSAYVLSLNRKQPCIFFKPLSINKREAGIHIQIALTYNTSVQEILKAYVNNIETREGGTHVTGFCEALTQTLKAYTQGFMSDKVVLSEKDWRAGLVAVISVEMKEPWFGGSTKTKISNPEVKKLVQEATKESLQHYIAAYPKVAKALIQKLVSHQEKA